MDLADVTLWCHLICSSGPCISCKLRLRSRSLIRLRLEFCFLWRGRPADSDGGWGLPASLSTHTRPQEGRAFLGIGNRGHSPPAPAHLSSNHGNRHWPVETLVPEFLASIWQRPSFSCKPSTDSFPPRLGGQGMNATRGERRKPALT